MLKQVNNFMQNHVGKFNKTFEMYIQWKAEYTLTVCFSFEGTDVNYSELMYYTLDEMVK